MTGLELQYRLLLRAYPSEHRSRYEDEMVGALMDVARPGQRRPDRREATSIVTSGLTARLQSSTEVPAGVRLAGVWSLAAVAALCGVGAGVAVRPPLTVSAVPLVMWIVVAAAATFGSWSQGRYGTTPTAVVAFVMLAAGADAMGLRRSTLLPGAVLLLLAGASRPAPLRAKLAAGIGGLALGGLVAAAVTADLSSFAMSSDGAATTTYRWWLASQALALLVPPPVAAGAAVAALAIGVWRLRYAVAGLLVMVPFALLPMIGYSWQTPMVVRARIAPALCVGAAALWLWWSVRTARAAGHSPGPPAA